VARDDDFTSAGRVGRPHGLDGSCHVTHPTPRLLALGSSATVAGRRRQIVRRAGTDASPIVRFEGVEDRDAVERLRGAEILVARDELPMLDDDEFWAHELEGCTVRAHTGGAGGGLALGVVRRVIELPSCEALEVELGGGGQLLVPMVKDAIRGVDVAHGLIEVDAAFLDVARSGTEGPA
jgi:16S rRNA processing protein RimM